ncbi:mitochondrial proton/calcium exchanger protein-like protein isoform X1 [Tanacetum coccineum]
MAEYSQKWHNGTSRGRSTETFDGLDAIQAQLNNLEREIKKVNEKVYAAQVGWGYRATSPGYYQRNNANPSYQERRQSMEDTLSKFMSESAKRHEENSNLIKEIRASTDAAIRNQGASIKTLEIQIGQMSKVLQERGFGSLPSSTETKLRYQVMSISTTIEANLHLIRRIGSSQYAISTGLNSTLLYKSRQMTVPFPSRLDNHYCEEEEGNYGPKFTEAYGASHINNTIPRKEKDLGSFTLPCFIKDVCFDNALVDLGANVSVMPLLTYLNLGLGELAHTRLIVELADRTIKYPKRIAKNVLVEIGKFTFLVDFIILDMLEDIKVPLILGRPFLYTARAKIDVYKRKITLRVGEEKIIFKSIKLASSLIKRVYMLSKVIEEFRTRDEDFDIGIDDYLSYCDDDKKIHIDFLEDIDSYRDEGMGDIIVGEPFLREVGIKAKHFEGIITLYNGDDEVTYQMVRLHPRFKNHTNEQCYKISPLLKVSEKDVKNGISHAYQKLKGFYKGVLNLGPNYIRNAKMEEWLTRGHNNVNETK